MTAHFSLEERFSRTWLTWLGQSCIKLIRVDGMMRAGRLLGAVPTPPVGSPKLDIPTRGIQKCRISHRIVEDFHVYDIKPAAQSSSRHKLIYFAGGGFQTAASPGHWTFCATMVNRIPNCSAVLVSYPLSPTNTAPTTYHLIQKVYLALVAEARAQNEVVIVGGDSAGGNLSLGLPLSTLKGNIDAPAPSIILALSPAVETSHENPGVNTIAPLDPLLSKAYCTDASFKWRGEWPNSDPRLSVLYADPSVLVERGIHVIGIIGKYDVLAPDAILLMNKYKEIGVSSDWLVWDKQMHCFTLPVLFPSHEGAQSVDWLLQKLLPIIGEED